MIDEYAITDRYKVITLTISPYDENRLPELFRRAAEILEGEKGMLEVVDFTVDDAGIHLSLYISERGND